MRKTETGVESISQALPVLEVLVETLTERPEVERVVLFGSRARGDSDERSDIDLAVEAPHATSREWIEISLLVEEAPTLLPFNLVRFESASPGLKSEILATGKTLYKRHQNITKSEKPRPRP